MERANRDVTERNNDLKGAGLQNRDKLTLLTGPGTGIAPNSKPLSRKTTLARANTTATDRTHSSVSLRTVWEASDAGNQTCYYSTASDPSRSA